MSNLITDNEAVGAVMQKPLLPPIKKRKSKVGKEGNVWVYVSLMALPMLQFILFYVVVNINSFKLAFSDIRVENRVTKNYGFTFDNFKEQFQFFFSARCWEYLKISLWGYFSHLIVGVPLGLMFAYYIYKRRFGSGFFRVLLFVPSIVPAIVMCTIYGTFVNNALPELLKQTFNLSERPGGSGFLADSNTTLVTLLFYNVLVGFGTSVLMYSNKMSSIDPSISEAARLDGAGALQEFFHVTLPMTYSTLSIFLVTAVANLFINQFNTFSFWGWTKTVDGFVPLGYYLFKGASDAINSENLFAEMSALGLVLTCIAIPLTFTLRYLLRKFGPKEE